MNAAAILAAAERVGIADASATKVYSSEHLQRLGEEFEEIVARHGDPADPDTARLSRWLDVQAGTLSRPWRMSSR